MEMFKRLRAVALVKVLGEQRLRQTDISKSVNGNILNPVWVTCVREHGIFTHYLKQFTPNEKYKEMQSFLFLKTLTAIHTCPGMFYGETSFANQIPPCVKSSVVFSSLSLYSLTRPVK